MRIRIRKGLDLAIGGAPRQSIESAREPETVALFEHDLPRGRYLLRVAVGDRVEAGQTLFVDRRRPAIVFPAPITGRVIRARRSEPGEGLVVEIQRESVGAGASAPASAPIGVPEHATAEGAPHRGRARPLALDSVLRLERGEVVSRLLAAGEWPALRSRPFGGIPDPEASPDALFIRAMDTNPLAAKAGIVLEGRMEALRLGVAALSRLLDGSVYVCCEPELELPLADLERVRVVRFEGPHPAGLAGTHVHRLHRLRAGAVVWTIGYQDVVAIGQLFGSGEREVERVVALAGPLVREPRLVRACIGSNSEELVRDALRPGACRIVSGSVLTGRRAASGESHLGLGHEQLVVLPEVEDEEPRGWMVPGRFGARGVPPWRRANRVTTALHGEPRAMFPLSVFESVVPLRIPVGLLLRALAAGDAQAARRFGALELVEEDLALCTHLCPAKLEYGGLLRAALDRLEAGRP